MPHDVLLPARTNPVSGFAALLSGGLVAALTVGLVLEEALPVTMRVGVGVVGGAVALVGVLGARKLIRPRGGVLVDVQGERLGFGLTGPDDVWWVPRARVRGLCTALAEPPVEGVPPRWVGVLALDGGLEIVLLESDTPTLANDIVRGLTEATGLPLGTLADADATEDGPHEGGTQVEPSGDGETPAETGDGGVTPSQPCGDGAPRREARPGRRSFGVRHATALGPMLVALGVAMAVVGAGLFARVDEAPVFGFLFGPALFGLGVTLLGVAATKRAAREELELADDGRTWTHRVRVCGRVLAHKQVTGSSPAWRLRLGAARGAHLELVGDDGVLVMGSGATTRSRDSVEALGELPGSFRAGAPDPASGGQAAR